ncbi:heavy-metal-associated domain-containing protein [Caulobacter sp. DWR1-3-2b1]|uniref:heavy-metal-associated domain-containing protein n=1 Tax=Caulobacter sp. DWR1-3-2b1 TaxID=2804670 RepID=UPI003CF74A49
MLRYQVDDMTCGHCAQAITQALKGLDPRAEVSVDLGPKQVAVTSLFASERIEHVIRAAGYTPRAVETAPSATKGGCCGSC